ncbi:MAG TPA: hypothetical protein ENK08_00190 [Chloroflexi bacterium]|nr:hypothetical protein [Chloroflexota bacterium]
MEDRVKQAEQEEHGEPIGRLMAGVDPELLAFLRAQVDSFTKWDLLHFFYENPHAADTAGNIALYIGRNSANVEADLDDLAKRGVLTVRHLGGMRVYSLSSDPVIWEQIRRFIQACGDREFRVKAIYHIVRGMR